MPRHIFRWSHIFGLSLSQNDTNSTPDSSLTRNDFFTSGGNDFEFNGTLFGMMTETTGGIYDFDGMSLYRSQRYAQSLAENPNFYFGPLALLLYGASSFVYELMPSGPDYIPDKQTISSFFGASENADGTYSFNGQEKIPDNWYNRVEPYGLLDVGEQILGQYLAYPVLFGGNTGNGGFDGLNFGDGIKDGSLVGVDATTVVCLIYQLATQSVPSSLDGLITPTVNALSFVLTKVNPQFANLGCPLALTK